MTTSRPCPDCPFRIRPGDRVVVDGSARLWPVIEVDLTAGWVLVEAKSSRADADTRKVKVPLRHIRKIVAAPIPEGEKQFVKAALESEEKDRG